MPKKLKDRLCMICGKNKAPRATFTIVSGDELIHMCCFGDIMKEFSEKYKELKGQMDRPRTAIGAQNKRGAPTSSPYHLLTEKLRFIHPSAPYIIGGVADKIIRDFVESLEKRIEELEKNET